MTSPIAVHEAAHVVAAFAFDIAVTGVSVRPTESHLGKAWVNASGFEPALELGIVFAAGRMGERMVEGRPGRTNWFDVDDPDVSRALSFLGETRDPVLARRVCDVRTYALLSTRWAAVRALADLLDRRGVLLGVEAEQLLADLGTRRAREKPRRPDDPLTRHAIVDGAPVLDKHGRPVSLRRWAKTLDGVGFNKRRALELAVRLRGVLRAVRRRGLPPRRSRAQTRRVRLMCAARARRRWRAHAPRQRPQSSPRPVGRFSTSAFLEPSGNPGPAYLPPAWSVGVGC